MKILITGASQGLGKTLAYQLAKKGHQLTLIARQKKKLESIAKELSPSAKVNYIVADLSNHEEIPEILEKYLKKDCPDVLINNLGVFQVGKASKMKIEDIKSQMDINLYAAVEITNQLLPYFKEREDGQIINIGSVASHSAIATSAAYSISKHALKAWNDALREELRVFGIKVTALYPSSINTTSWDGVENVDLSKMIQKEDLASLIDTLINLGKSTLVDEIRLSPLQDFFIK